jgi:hypothetical protein
MDQWHVDAVIIPSLINEGEVIEEYPHDRPYPSRLVLWWDGSEAVHAVVADVPTTDETIVITVYRPDPGRWENDYRTRRQP